MKSVNGLGSNTFGERFPIFKNILNLLTFYPKTSTCRGLSTTSMDTADKPQDVGLESKYQQILKDFGISNVSNTDSEYIDLIMKYSGNDLLTKLKNIKKTKHCSINFAEVCFVAIMAKHRSTMGLDFILKVADVLDIKINNIYYFLSYCALLDQIRIIDAQSVSLKIFINEHDRLRTFQQALHYAALGGHLDVIEYLDKKLPKINGIPLFICDAYLGAAKNAHLDVMGYIDSKQGRAKDLIQADDYYVYQVAAENGHLSVMEYIASLVGYTASDCIKANYFAAYRNAAENGHLHILEYLEENVNARDLVRMISMLHGNYPFLLAAKNGHIHILKHMGTKFPDEVAKMIEYSDFHGFKEAVKSGNSDVACQLLSLSSRCLAYAEPHEREYGANVRSFISSTLHDLRERCANIAPIAVFDLDNPEQAKICFYILRNLIRQNRASLNDDIQFLLNIPSVRILAHQSVNGGMENELLRLASSIGNAGASQKLLNIEAVRLLGERNQFYREENRGGIDLSALARDRESSMTALSLSEQRRLESAIKRYQPMIAQTGIANLIKELKDELEERYNANPATIEMDGKKIVLPIGYAEFEMQNLKGQPRRDALESYYQHKVHTAYRYLSKPNRWIHRDTSYVCVDNERNCYANFEEYQSLIGMFWLAAQDKEYPPIDGHTLDSRLEHFIDELALIGRAHNWDKTRVRKDGSGNEEYDDLEGDRPSCFSGVKRRLFQSVLGHSLLTILTEDIVLQEIREFAINYFKCRITERNRDVLLGAYNHYLIELSDKSAAPLAILNITHEAIADFKVYMNSKYGESYTCDASFIKLTNAKLMVKPDSKVVAEHFSVLNLDELVVFLNILSPQERVSQVGLFSTNNPQKVDEVKKKPRLSS